MSNEKPKQPAPRIIDVVYEENYFPELDAYPLYEVISSGENTTIKVNPGTKKVGDILFFDVTMASDDFKEQHASVIEELNVHETIEIRSLKDRFEKAMPKATNSLGQIIAILPIPSVTYDGLSAKEKKALGGELFLLSNTEQGIKMLPYLSKRGYEDPDNVCLLISSDKISPELFEKIAPDVKELVSIAPGVYKENGGVSVQKTNLGRM